MGCNESFSYEFGNYTGWQRSAYSYGRYQSLSYPTYLSEMARGFLDLSSMNKNFLWPARTYTGALNRWTMYAAAPYSKVHVFTNGRTYYSVSDMNYFGSGIKAQSIDSLGEQYSAMIGASGVKNLSAKLGAKWHMVKSLSSYADSKDLDATIKADIKYYVDLATEALKDLDTLLANENGLTANEISEMLMADIEEVDAIIEETNDLFEDIQEQLADASEERTRAAAQRRSSSRSGRSGSSSSEVKASGTESGSKVDEMPADEENSEITKTRYGVKPEASVEECANAADLATQASAVTDKASFEALFGTNKDINQGNIVEVLDAMSDKAAFVDKLAALGTDSKKALITVADLLEKRVKSLESAGHISEDDALLVKQAIERLDFKAKDVTTNKTAIVDELNSIINTLKDKGTEDAVNTLIVAKQNEAKTLAAKEFRKAYAEDTADGVTGKTYDATKNYGDLPDEIKYLPNSQLFVATVTVNGTAYIFKAGNFKNLNDVIVKHESEVSGITVAWKEIKAKLLVEPSV